MRDWWEKLKKGGVIAILIKICIIFPPLLILIGGLVVATVYGVAHSAAYVIAHWHQIFSSGKKLGSG